MLCDSFIVPHCIPAEPVAKQVAFNPFVVSLGNGASHVDRDTTSCNNDDDKRNDVPVLIEGLGRVGSDGGKRRCSGVVRRPCMSSRGVKSRLKSIAYSDTTNTSISDNDDNMTTTDNDDKTTEARRATFNAPGHGHHLPAGAPYKVAGGAPKRRPSVPAGSLIIVQSPNGPARPVLPCFQPPAACTGYCAYTQPRSQVYSEQHMPRPPVVVGTCKPLADLVDSSTIQSTQGTGTQGKTRGQDPGVRLSPLCEEEHAARFAKPDFSPLCE